MCCVIFIPGGLLIMMGQHVRSEALFYYFTLEEYIPENHLLRLIDKHTSTSVSFVNGSRTATARPEYPPSTLSCYSAFC